MGNASTWPVSTSHREETMQEQVVDLTNPKSQQFPKETRTGEWFAAGDENLHVVPPSLIPPPSLPPPRASRARRITVRLVGFLAIAGTLACLIRIGTYPPARQAILRWGSFGRATHSELPIGAGAARAR
jgi:hypothetical protein